MPRSTTSIRLPDDLLEALDERAAALGVTGSQLIIEAVEQALADRSAWSPGFLKRSGRRVAASRRRRLLEAQWSAIGPELIRVPWSDEVSRRFGERKARLEKAGQRMSDFDLAIAVHALAYGLTLVTAERGFERLKLRRENWLV